jgi:hypothetical protein
MPRHVSSISPPVEEKPKIRFNFLEKNSIIDSYQSYAKEGFADSVSPQAERPYLNHQDFFNRVNISKGPILVTVESIVRTMAPDWSSSKHERKEYMYYTMQWEAQDWLGNTIKHGHEHEGKYVQQTKEIVTVPDPKQPHMTIKQYHKSRPRDVYTLLWNSKEAQKILTGEKVFGADSVNITNPIEVQYMGYFLNQSPYKTKFGMEDFLSLTFDKLLDSVKTSKSPYLEELQRKSRPYG